MKNARGCETWAPVLFFGNQCLPNSISSCHELAAQSINLLSHVHSALHRLFGLCMQNKAMILSTMCTEFLEAYQRMIDHQSLNQLGLQLILVEEHRHNLFVHTY